MKNQNLQQKGTFKNFRANVLFCLFMIAFTLVIFRVLNLYFTPPGQTNLTKIASHQYSRKVNLSHFRGTIYDRRDVPLAISVRYPSVAINPKLFNPTPSEAKKIARLLKISSNRINKIAKKDTYFAWLKRKVSHETARKIKFLGIKGIHYLNEPDRYYTTGTRSSHLVGFVNIDDKGQLGIERKYEKDLKGLQQAVNLTRDAKGNLIILESRDVTSEVRGNSVHLTLDRAIQEYTMDALQEGVKNAGAKRGFAIVADPNTGKILSMASYPSFDPNNRAKFRLSDTRNHALLGLFEPGSTLKPLFAAAAIEKKIISKDTILNCEGGRLAIAGGVIRDDHPDDELSVQEAIVKSNNICAYKIADKLGPENSYNTLKSFGITEKEASLGFAGESSGRLQTWKKWKPMRFANIAFGQGLVVKPLEMVTAFNALANGGRYMQPYLVEKVMSPENIMLFFQKPKKKRQIISEQTSHIMRKILHEVSINGTAKNAQTLLYSVAGKTGTAEKVDPKTRAYSPTKRLASFIGFAPAYDPHIVVYVAIDEPTKRPYYGGVWAAPVFSKIVSETLPYLNVPSDKPSAKAMNSHDPKG